MLYIVYVIVQKENINFFKLNLGLQKVLNIFKLNVEVVYLFFLVEYVDINCKVKFII